MKYMWEPHDVICGRRVWSWNRSITGEYILGYDCNDREVARWYIMVSLSDGSVIFKCDTIDGMVKHLNHYGYRPADINLLAWPDIAPKDD